MAALLMVAISVLLISSASGAANTGGRISGLGTALKKKPLTVKSSADQGPGDRSLATVPSDDPDEPIKPHWEPLFSIAPEAGTTVGEWKFDGNGNNQYAGSSATLVENATFETTGGISDGYAKIPLGSDSVSIAYNSLYDLPDTFSIEFWFRQRANQSFLQDLVFKGEANGYNFRVFRQLWDGSNDGPVIAGFTNTSGSWEQVSTPNDLAHNIWHYVAYTKSATTHTYYLDGNRIDFADTTDVAKIAASQPIEIGTSAVDTDIDELRISNYGKTGEDVSTYYNSFLPVANAGSDQNVCEDSTVTLNGTGSTIPSGTTVTYEWTQTDGTSVGTITDSDKAQATFTAPGVGSGGEALTFQLKVTNNAAQESTDTCTVNVADTLVSGTYYVDITSGNDSNSGTSGSQWKTLHHALYMINNGNTGTYILIMAAGTYSIANGEADSAITLTQSNVTIFGADDHTIGASNTTTLIDGTDATTWIKGIKTTGSSITIKGLSMTKFDATGGYGIEISGGTGNEVVNCKVSNNDTGIEITSSSAFKIRGCEIYSNTTDGLNVTASTAGEIHRNTIHKHVNDSITGKGISVLNCSPSIKRNMIYDNNIGIRVDANYGTASPDIGNNVIYETEPYFMDYGILVKNYQSSDLANPTIYHNSIDGGSGDGIAIELVSGSSLATIIKYNIITNCEGYGIDDGIGVLAENIAYNDVWSNTLGNYHGCSAGTGGISEDPKNGQAGPLASDSPCINKIPPAAGDDAIMDYLGYKRPRVADEWKDMGAYEYVAQQTYSDTLPGGTGAVTDYRIFTIPLDIGTGADMQSTLEGTLGTYDRTKWRVFSYTTNGDVEMTTQAFSSLDIKPGLGLWGITVLTDTISFTGTLAPDAIYYRVQLEPGWHLFAVPWPATNINLDKIYVTDGVNQYAITDASNTLTQQKIWDYTGTGPYNGYEQRTATDFSLGDGVGFYINVLVNSNIILSIPPDNSSDPPNNSSVSASSAMRYGSPESLRLSDDSETPPLPTGSYGPMPDIRADGKSGPVTVSRGTPVSVKVSLDPGNRPLKKADWWVVAHTPFVPPNNWYSYVYPDGWQPGIHVCVQMLPFQLARPFEVLNMALPAGDYTFYFAVDENADGIVDETWVDSVEVRVE